MIKYTKQKIRYLLMTQFIQFKLLKMSDDELGQLFTKLRLW